MHDVWLSILFSSTVAAKFQIYGGGAPSLRSVGSAGWRVPSLEDMRRATEDTVCSFNYQCTN